MIRDARGSQQSGPFAVPHVLQKVEIMAVPKIHPMRVRNPKQALLALHSSPDPPHSSCTLGGQVICLVAVKELNLSFDNVRGFRA